MFKHIMILLVKKFYKSIHVNGFEFIELYLNNINNILVIFL